MQWALVFVALVILGVAAVSGRLSGTMVTPAMVLMTAGVLVGPTVLSEVDPSTRGPSIRILAEATLTLVLFSDASRINVRALWHEAGVPVRLLGVGLPLTIGFGALAAAVL